jgi:PTH1 family peptidyl-tRNA hydrolase
MLIPCAPRASRGASSFEDSPLKLFVGLGNPGGSYARNRHNVGFMAVDAIAAAHGFGPWRGKFQGEIAEGRLGNEKVLLLKPGTYMNLSGDSVRAALQFYKLEPGDVTVFHDELDLAPGRVRVKAGGGHAGHNGLRSIDAHLGPAFTRVRIGIGHPGDKRLVSPYVLGDFAKDETEWVDDLLRGIADGAPALAGGDSAGFLNAIVRRLPPPDKPKPASAKTDAPPAAVMQPEPEPERSALQRLVDRFR